MNCKRVLSELFEDDSRRNENSIGASLANELADGSHEHTRKTEQLLFCESPKEDVNNMSFVHENSVGASLANESAAGSHEHTRKTEQLFFCESPNEEVNEMSLVHERIECSYMAFRQTRQR